MYTRHIHIFPLHVLDSRIMENHGIARDASYPEYQFLYSLSGSGILYDDRNIRYEIRPGDVLFLSAHTSHRYYEEGEETWMISYISFNGLSIADGFLDLLDIPSPIYVFRKETLEDPELISSLFYQCAQAYAERSYADDLVMHTILYRLTYELYRTLHKSGTPAGKADSALSDLFAYIRQNLSAPLSVESIAKATGRSVYDLYHQFHSVLGMTPWEYVVEARLHYAKQLLLREPEMSIREIGIAAGMPAKNYLNRHFKQRYGMTPNEYRKKNASSVSPSGAVSFSEKTLPVYFLDSGESNIRNPESWQEIRNGNCYQIMLCLDGAGVLIDEKGAEHAVNPGYLCFFAPGSECRYDPVVRPWNVIWVRFHGKNIKKLLRLLGITETAVISGDKTLIVSHRYCNDMEYDFVEHMDQIHASSWRTDPASIFYRSVLLYELLLCTGIMAEIRNEPTNEEEQLIPVIDMIHMQYRNKLSLSLLADHIGVTTGTLIRLFQIVYRKTPKEYLTEVRIRQAKRRLLRHPNETVRQIAEEVGFSGASHFITVFRQSEHMTPEEYRALYL